jgi:hypothetical protein
MNSWPGFCPQDSSYGRNVRQSSSVFEGDFSLFRSFRVTESALVSFRITFVLTAQKGNLDNSVRQCFPGAVSWREEEARTCNGFPASEVSLIPIVRSINLLDAVALAPLSEKNRSRVLVPSWSQMADQQ